MNKRVRINVSNSKFKGLTTWDATIEIEREVVEEGDIKLEWETLEVSNSVIEALRLRYPEATVEIK